MSASPENKIRHYENLFQNKIKFLIMETDIVQQMLTKHCTFSTELCMTNMQDLVPALKELSLVGKIGRRHNYPYTGQVSFNVSEEVQSAMPGS